MVLIVLVGIYCVAFLIGHGGSVGYFNMTFQVADLTLFHRLLLIALSILTWGVMNVLLLGLWIATSANVPPSLQVHNDSFGIGIIIIVIAWFMDMAVDLREENELTI